MMMEVDVELVTDRVQLMIRELGEEFATSLDGVEG